MNTFILNLNDATALNDSVVARFVKLSDVCQSVVTKAGTNDADVEITKYICCAVVTVAAIIVGGFLIWKLIDHLANAIAGCYKRRFEVEDLERKQKSDLKNKLIDFLEKMTINEKYNEDNDKVIKIRKGMDTKESQYYTNVLKSLIDDKEIADYSQYKHEDKTT